MRGIAVVAPMAIVCSTALAACSSSSGNGAPTPSSCDAGAPRCAEAPHDAGEGGSLDAGERIADSSADAVALRTVATVVRLGANDECLPQPLPTTEAGETSCRILIDGLNGECAGAGLAPASPDDMAAIASAHPTGSVCDVTQLGAAATSGCTAPGATGWCYVHGACPDSGAQCGEAICATSTFVAAHEAPVSDGAALEATPTTFLLCP
jgi:hypothetical protein